MSQFHIKMEKPKNPDETRGRKSEGRVKVAYRFLPETVEWLDKVVRKKIAKGKTSYIERLIERDREERSKKGT